MFGPLFSHRKYTQITKCLSEPPPWPSFFFPIQSSVKSWMRDMAPPPSPSHRDAMSTCCFTFSWSWVTAVASVVFVASSHTSYGWPYVITYCTEPSLAGVCAVGCSPTLLVVWLICANIKMPVSFWLIKCWRVFVTLWGKVSKLMVLWHDSLPPVAVVDKLEQAPFLDILFFCSLATFFGVYMTRSTCARKIFCSFLSASGSV